MSRRVPFAFLILGVISPTAVGQQWALAYVPSHRATFEQEWTYTYPRYESTRWILALRYPPSLAWSKDVEGKAELLTSKGWVPFKKVSEESAEQRPMLFLDFPHDDPKLRNGFTVRTTLTATICDQQLVRVAGGPRRKSAPPAAALTEAEKEAYLQATHTFDFDKPAVKKWMDEHKMWRGKKEGTVEFVHRVYKELRLKIPYNTGDGGEWICSQILKVGFGECCRHGIVGTSILRANKIPARTVCGLWAIDEKSKGAHCWGEFFLDGVGWVPYDTTIDSENTKSEAYFGSKKGEVLAGMVDFDWVIDTHAFGTKTVAGIDAWPGVWSEGKGDMNNAKTSTTTRVHIVKRFR
jgi:transglutaminase-like putative cysteine protease